MANIRSGLAFVCVWLWAGALPVQAELRPGDTLDKTPLPWLVAR